MIFRKDDMTLSVKIVMSRSQMRSKEGMCGKDRCRQPKIEICPKDCGWREKKLGLTGTGVLDIIFGRIPAIKRTAFKSLGLKSATHPSRAGGDLELDLQRPEPFVLFRRPIVLGAIGLRNKGLGCQSRSTVERTEPRMGFSDKETKSGRLFPKGGRPKRTMVSGLSRSCFHVPGPQCA